MNVPKLAKDFPLWKAYDDFWLTVPQTEGVSALLIALGKKSLRITASFDGDDGMIVNRNGYIDVNILSFDRTTGDMRVSIVENTTGLRLNSQTLNMKVDEVAESESCHINQIDGIIF